MNKMSLLILVAVLLSPTVVLLSLGVMMNPAASSCLQSSMVVGGVPDRVEAATSDGTPIVLDRTQLTRAATILTVGSRTPGITREGMLIALIAGLTESRLRMLANTSTYPDSAGYDNEGDGGDHDSLGMFQMRPQAGWGTVEELMDPDYQARAFYGGPTGPNRGSPRGLLDIPRWETLGLGEAAQTVEVSAYPERYQVWEPVARTILAALTRPSSGSGTNPVVSAPSRVVFPLPDGTWVVSSPFGPRVHPVTGEQESFHTGTDYAAPDGTPILAVADGQVVFSGPLGGYGTAIIVTHTIGGHTVGSLYGHMWDGHLYVKTGDRVAAEQHIADVGSNGRSTGPHLHLEIRTNNDPDQLTDPDQWLARQGATPLTGPNVGTTGCYTRGGRR